MKKTNEPKMAELVKKLQSKTRIAKMRKDYENCARFCTCETFDQLLEEALNPWSDANFGGYECVMNSDGSKSIHAEFGGVNAVADIVDGKCNYFRFDDRSGCDSRGYGFSIGEDGGKHYFNSAYALELKEGTEEIDRMFDYIFVQRRMHKRNWILDNVDRF